MQPSLCQEPAAEAAPAHILLDPAKLLGGAPSATGAVASGVKQVGVKQIPSDLPPPQVLAQG